MTTSEAARIRRFKKVLFGLGQLDLDSTDLRQRLEALQARAVAALRDTRGNIAALKYARQKASARHRQIGEMTERRVRPVIKQLRVEGFNTYKALAAELTRRGVRPPRSRDWNATSVRNIEIRHRDE